MGCNLRKWSFFITNNKTLQHKIMYHHLMNNIPIFHPSWLVPLLHISTWSHSCCSHLAWLDQFKVNCHQLENTNFLVIVIVTIDAIPLFVFTTVPYLKCVFGNDLCPEARQMVYSQPPQNAQFFPSKFATTIEYDAYIFFFNPHHVLYCVAHWIIW